jgi:hypothetical protein
MPALSSGDAVGNRDSLNHRVIHVLGEVESALAPARSPYRRAVDADHVVINAVIVVNADGGMIDFSFRQRFDFWCLCRVFHFVNSFVGVRFVIVNINHPFNVSIGKSNSVKIFSHLLIAAPIE